MYRKEPAESPEPAGQASGITKGPRIVLRDSHVHALLRGEALRGHCGHCINNGLSQLRLHSAKGTTGAGEWPLLSFSLPALTLHFRPTQK